MKSSAEERFWPKVDKKGPDGCWLWTATINNKGYGQFPFGLRNHTVLAHRFAYELLVGPIPTDLEIDHLCRTRACVNPSHLEPVTRRENVLRGLGPGIQRAKTHCPKGHPYDLPNTRIYQGRRFCRQCKLDRYQKKGTAWAERTHCKHGHPYNESNTRWQGKTRLCITCRRDISRGWARRKRHG